MVSVSPAVLCVKDSSYQREVRPANQATVPPFPDCDTAASYVDSSHMLVRWLPVYFEVHAWKGKLSIRNRTVCSEMRRSRMIRLERWPILDDTRYSQSGTMSHDDKVNKSAFEGLPSVSRNVP